MIKPTRNNILIEIHEEKNISGIVFTNEEDSKMEKGSVIAIGDQVEFIKVGDIVYFKKYSLDTIKDDKEYHLIVEDEIKAVYEPFA